MKGKVYSTYSPDNTEKIEQLLRELQRQQKQQNFPHKRKSLGRRFLRNLFKAL